MSEETEPVLLDVKDSQRLQYLLQEAHYHAALAKDNLSKVVFLQSFAGSQEPMHSVASGLLSTGAVHGPLTETRHMMAFMKVNQEAFFDTMVKRLSIGDKMPGLGNSFYKDGIDPAFNKVVDFYRQIHIQYELGTGDMDAYAGYINVARAKLFGPEKKQLHLNAAGITAGVCQLLGALPFFENWFFIAGRSRAWLEIIGKEATKLELAQNEPESDPTIPARTPEQQS